MPEQKKGSRLRKRGLRQAFLLLYFTLNDVSFSYENSREGESQLRHVNLQVAQGELVILAGRSGCGKTTLTRVLNGLCPQFYPGELTGSYLLGGQCVPGSPQPVLYHKYHG
mgnify:CR=1 FL=1